MVNKTLGKYTMIGAGLGVTSYALSMLYRLSGIGASGIQSSLEFAPIAAGVKQSIQGGLSTDLASNLIGLLNGVIGGAGLMGFLTLLVAGIIVGIVGGYTVDFLTSMQMFKGLGKGIIIKLVSIAVVGTLLSAFVVSAFAGTPELPVVSGVITMVLYFTVVGFAYALLANATKKMPQLKQLFPDPR